MQETLAKTDPILTTPAGLIGAIEERAREGIHHVLSLSCLDQETVQELVLRSIDFASGVAARPFHGKIVGICFPRPSTRTRTAFTCGALKLGARTVTYGPNDLQLSTGETYEDTGRVLSGYLDALVIRTNGPQADMEALAQQDRMPVVNAMSAEEHPTQALADLSTIQEHFGRLEDLHVLYLGEGNNSASALAFGLGHFPNNRLTLMTPENEGLPMDTLARAQGLAQANGTEIVARHDVEDLPSDVDVVYTTRWQTMGEPKSDPDWRRQYRPYGVTTAMMEKVARDARAIFMHDLPAVRGDDVTSEVLDGARSLAWRQARYKMWSAMAVLEWCAGCRDRC